MDERHYDENSTGAEREEADRLRRDLLTQCGQGGIWVEQLRCTVEFGPMNTGTDEPAAFAAFDGQVGVGQYGEDAIGRAIVWGPLSRMIELCETMLRQLRAAQADVPEHRQTIEQAIDQELREMIAEATGLTVGDDPADDIIIITDDDDTDEGAF